MKINYSEKALLDLEIIYIYSFREFGEKTATKYHDKIVLSVCGLVENPMMGVNVSFLVPNMRKLQVTSHFVFYQVKKNNIFIARILHQSQDVERHL